MPKPPSLKVTPDNLVRLGADRLAEILVDVAGSRPELKRRLRIELAAEKGLLSLTAEIDKRLLAFETSRGKVGWRQKPTLLREIGVLGELIVQRLAPLDRDAARSRLWRHLGSFSAVRGRMKDSDDPIPVYAAAVGGLAELATDLPPDIVSGELAAALVADPQAWVVWLPDFILPLDPQVARLTLQSVGKRTGSGWPRLIRQLADAAGDAEAFHRTYAPAAVAMPEIAAEVARRYLAAGQTDRAGEVLEAARPKPRLLSGKPEINFEWETVWIEYLAQSGQMEQAQAARWSSFERTLSVFRARSFIQPLADFDDVEAETEAFAIAAKAADFEAGLAFFMAWPQLGEAGRMIEARPDDIKIDPDLAQVWAERLSARQPRAAELLLRKTAAVAFRSRDYKTSDRLTEAADALGL